MLGHRIGVMLESVIGVYGRYSQRITYMSCTDTGSEMFLFFFVR